MMPKKPDAQKRRPTGVSLEASLLAKAKSHAKKKGYASLSAMIAQLLREAIEEAKNAAENSGHAQVEKAKRKLRRRRSY